MQVSSLWAFSNFAYYADHHQCKAGDHMFQAKPSKMWRDRGL